MFGALGALSGSKNPLINPIAMLDKKDKGRYRDHPGIPEGTPIGSTVTSAGPLSQRPRYGRGAQSLSI